MRLRAKAAAEAALDEASGTTPAPPQKSHRRFRRKLKSRNEEYASRSAVTGSWLPTHVWHAKRMTMRCMWGYKLAITPNQKVFRFNRRMAQSGSCAYDFSYLQIFTATVEFVEDFLRRYTTLQDAFFETQQIEYVAESELLIENVVASSLLVWRQSEENGSQRVILFVHPSAEFSVKQHLLQNGFEQQNDLYHVFLLIGPQTVERVSTAFQDPLPSLRPFGVAKSVLKPRSENSAESPMPISLGRLADAAAGIPVYACFGPRLRSKCVWRAIIHSNCKPYALEDLLAFCFENNRLLFPFHCPTSQAFFDVYAAQSASLHAAWSRKPPAKRVNYARLGIQSPFDLAVLSLKQKQPLLCYAVGIFEAATNGVPRYNAHIYWRLPNDEAPQLVGCVIRGGFSLAVGKGKAFVLLCVLCETLMHFKQTIVHSPIIMQCQNIDASHENPFFDVKLCSIF